MYHSVVDNPALTENTIGTSKSISVFDAHIRTLAKHFAPVSLDQIVEFANGGDALPPRAVAVTFDDGFLDNYEVAVPILNRYGVPAIFYIMVNAVETGIAPWYCRINFALRTTRKSEWVDPDCGQSYHLETPQGRKSALTAAWAAGARKTGPIQEEFILQLETSLEVDSMPMRQDFMMTWDQVGAIRKAGHIIGGHTLTHPNLAHVTEQEVRSEIAGCKKRLEEKLGEPVEHFSYPHPALEPQYTEQTVETTRDAGFKSAVLTSCGPVRVGDDPLRLKRIYSANDLNQWMFNLESTFLGRKI
jgi:peptidoglycan/xylan/chitin deacetylase (PgdA/CDA1 family)